MTLQTRRLLARLLDALRAEGYPLGPGKLLQVEELLRQLPPETGPAALRTQLAPLFTSTAEQQARFYERFDQLLAQLRAEAAAEETPGAPPPEAPEVQAAQRAETRWRRAALGGLLALVALAGFLADPHWWPTWIGLAGALLAAGVAGWKLTRNKRARLSYLALLPLLAAAGFGLKIGVTPVDVTPDTEYSPRTQRLQVEQGRTEIRNIQPAGDTATLQSAAFCDGQTAGELPDGSRYALDSLGRFSFTAAPEAEVATTDSLCAEAVYAGRRDTVYFVVDVFSPGSKPSVDTLLTIDENLQKITENALISALDYHDAEWGTAVIMEVETGAIRAVANFGRSEDGWEDNFNHALASGTEPGSIFQLASIMALLEDEYVELEDSIDIEQGRTEFYDEAMFDTSPESARFGAITVRQAFEMGSNVGIAKLVTSHYGERTSQNDNEGASRFIRRLREFDLHRPSGIIADLDDLLNNGPWPVDEEPLPYIKEAYSEEDLWSTVTLPWMSVGYELKITPLQLLTFYNAVANDGTRVRPYLISEIQQEGETIETFGLEVVKEKIASESTIRAAQELLLGVVERKYGTAGNLKTDRYMFAGKTGTAQINYQRFSAGRRIGGYQASFAGYFPAEAPKYSCIVVIRNPRQNGIYGADVAGPVFREIADKYYGERIAELTLPFPRELPVINVTTQAWLSFLNRWQWPVKALLWLLLAGIAWALVRWYERRRARVVAEIEQRDQPPYVWRIETGEETDIDFGENLALLLNRLRRRESGEGRRLDGPATVQATVRRAGQVQFVYRRPTRPPEYLLLIDRYDANDHRARLFDTLNQELHAAEVYIERYFYHGDPRHCFNEAHPGGVSLTELLHRHRDARLLLVGEGRRLLAPTGGQPLAWTTIFEGWRRRALLLTSPANTWGRREDRLGALFPLAPATLQGLDLLLEQFETLEQRSPREVVERITDTVHDPIEFRGSLFGTLRRYYHEDLIRWIAACAVYPALHWDLTLHLGRELSTGEAPLLTSDHLRQLARLPWFIEGRMPEGAREQLLDYLAEQGLEKRVRRALDDLLQQTRPPEGSVAYDDFRMNVVLNRLLLDPPTAERRELEREFGRYLAAGKRPDFVTFQLLDREPSRLDLLVPEGLKRLLFRHGQLCFGWRPRPLLWGLWALLALAIAFLPVPENVCEGELVTYQDQTLCLDSPEDRLVYLELLTKDAIEVQAHERVDILIREVQKIAAGENNQSEETLLDERDSTFIDLYSYYQNSATYYFNFGTQLYNCVQSEKSECPEFPTRGLLAWACYNFFRGDSLVTLTEEKPNSSFLKAVQKTCGGSPGEVFDQVIAMGDSLVKMGEIYWRDALEYFEVASNLGGDEALVNEKMESLLGDMDARFEELLTSADGIRQFSGCRYALDVYMQAAELKPDNEEVQQKIRECGGAAGSSLEGELEDENTNNEVSEFEFFIPTFPWPPPSASASMSLPRDLFSRNNQLNETDEQLRRAINKTGYAERSYYAVPGGFALVTQIEQFDPEDGSSLDAPSRWSSSIDRSGGSSVRDYTKSLFFGEERRFRVFVFIVSPVPFSQSGEILNIEDAENWLSRGLDRLPSAIGRKAFTEDQNCTVLVYEFSKNEAGQAQMIGTSRFSANTHLERAGILNFLRRN